MEHNPLKDNNEHFPTETMLVIDEGEFNLVDITALFTQNGIKVKSLNASNGAYGAEREIKGGHVPVERIHLVLEASKDEVKEVLEKSEFKDRSGKLFENDLN